MATINRRTLFTGGAIAVAGYAAFRLSPPAGAAETFEVVRTDDEWRRLLTKPQYVVLRAPQTEWAGSSPLNHETRAGVYHCAGCQQALFGSATKYDSGTGWPSFWQPMDGAIATRDETALLVITQTEVHCRRCGGHLGHVFADGPPPTGQRYCMNGIALTFEAI
jgi:peptide-methionine (R)-S-oxide reductase